MITPQEVIKQDIIDHLIWDDGVNANDVYIHIENGNVRLTGKVPNFSAKMAATQDAYMIAGVKNVDNQLEVGFVSTGNMPDDAEITSNVRHMLLWNNKLISSNIRVESLDRIVTLSGNVETYWEKYLAEDIANKARGVKDVINLLQVELKKTMIDLDIQKDIENALKRSHFIDEKTMEVSVNNGVVTLSGTVINYPVKRQALYIAMHTAGVTDVNDEINLI